MAFSAFVVLAEVSFLTTWMTNKTQASNSVRYTNGYDLDVPVLPGKVCLLLFLLCMGEKLTASDQHLRVVQHYNQVLVKLIKKLNLKDKKNQMSHFFLLKNSSNNNNHCIDRAALKAEVCKLL